MNSPIDELSNAPVPEHGDGRFHHKFANVNGVQLHYVIGGSGRPLVLLHGFPQTWYAWRKLMPGLARRCTVIVPDLRGAGLSQKPATGYDKQTMAEDIHQLVLQLGYRDIDLAGHDIGVAVAYAYAAAHRDEVRHLMLLDVPPQGTRAFSKMARDSWVFRLHAQRPLCDRLVAGRERLYLTEGFFYSMCHDRTAFDADAIEHYVNAYSQPDAMRAALDWYGAFERDIAANRLSLQKPLIMPVLGMAGAQSGAPLMPAALQEIGVNVRSVTVERCGHWMLDEQPLVVQRAIFVFLEIDE